MFTDRELEMLSMPYFRLVRYHEDFCEIQSRDSGHYWGILTLACGKRNSPDTEYVLLHRHTADELYHEHARMTSVLDLVLEIIDHDDYTLNRRSGTFAEVLQRYGGTQEAQKKKPAASKPTARTDDKDALPEIDTVAAIRVLLPRRDDLSRYQWIMDHVHTTDVSKDRAFQKAFTGFYRLRRGALWLNRYYALFEQCKSEKHPEFDAIVDALFAQTGRVEASFSSKLLATLRPSMPIYDSHVLSFFGLELRGSSPEARLTGVKTIYLQLVRSFLRYAEQAEHPAIAAFDQAFPEFAGFAPVKKLDFMIWAAASVKQGS